MTAYRRHDNPDQFGFGYDYRQPGTYHLRVFPPEAVAQSPSTFQIPLEVK